MKLSFLLFVLLSLFSFTLEDKYQDREFCRKEQNTCMKPCFKNTEETKGKECLKKCYDGFVSCIYAKER